MLPVAVHFQKEMFNLNKSRDLHLQRVMNTFLGFCAELSGLALYYYSLSIIRSCTRQIFRRLLNPPYQFEIPCWQMQRDGEGSHSQAKTAFQISKAFFVRFPVDIKVYRAIHAPLRVIHPPPLVVMSHSTWKGSSSSG